MYVSLFSIVSNSRFGTIICVIKRIVTLQCVLSAVEVWLEYLQFSIGYMSKDEEGVEKVRQLFEHALTVVGTHVTKGAIIWEAYREYENMIYISLLPLVRVSAYRNKFWTFLSIFVLYNYF